MSERDALLRTIREHPEDDAPRLMFADWLDERTGKGATADHEWAAVIRQAIDQERLPRSDPRYLEVRRQQPEPPAQVRRLLPQRTRVNAKYSRGFADCLGISHRNFLKTVRCLTDCTAPLRGLAWAGDHISEGGCSAWHTRMRSHDYSRSSRAVPCSTCGTSATH